MESFNKNWLAIIIIAVVFFLLGFLIGKTSFHHKCNDEHKMMKWIEKSDCMSSDDEYKVDVNIEKILDDVDIKSEKGDSNKVVVIKKIIK